MAHVFKTSLLAACLALSVAVLDAEVVRASTRAAVDAAGDDIDGAGIWNLARRESERSDHGDGKREHESGDFHANELLRCIAVGVAGKMQLCKFRGGECVVGRMEMKMNVEAAERRCK